MIYSERTSERGVRNEILPHGIIDYLGEGVYLQFDGTDIKNERHFEERIHWIKKHL